MFTDSETEPPRVCTSSEFMCTSGECLDSSLHCNRRYDCSDGSDEFDCCEFNYQSMIGSFISFFA